MCLDIDLEQMKRLQLSSPLVANVSKDIPPDGINNNNNNSTNNCINKTRKMLNYGRILDSFQYAARLLALRTPYIHSQPLIIDYLYSVVMGIYPNNIVQILLNHE